MYPRSLDAPEHTHYPVSLPPAHVRPLKNRRNHLRVPLRSDILEWLLFPIATRTATNATVAIARSVVVCISAEGVMAPGPVEQEQAPERFRDYLVMLARMQLGRDVRARLDASDLVQQTLLDAHRDRDQFRGQGEADMAAWLRRLLACNILDAHRAVSRAKRDIARERSLDIELDQSSSRLGSCLIADQTSPSQDAQLHERAIWLAAALAKLPEAQRLALLRRYVEGLSVSEIGRELGRTPAAVAGLLKRGTQALRTLLDTRG